MTSSIPAGIRPESRPFPSAEARGLARVQERELETLAARLVPEGSAASCEVSLWDFSCRGFGVVATASACRDLGLAPGREARLRIDIGTELLEFACRIANVTPWGSDHADRAPKHLRDRARIGLILLEQGPPVLDDGSLTLPESAQIFAESAHPLLYDAWAELRLVGLAPGLRLLFASSDETLCVGPGQSVTLRLNLPTSEADTFVGRIERTQIQPSLFSVHPHGLSPGYANELGEWLATAGGLSPETLRAYGFPLRFFRQRAMTSFVESQEEYEAVLRLRRTAYVEAGKKSEATRAEDMSSTWDRQSRILCVHHRDQLVASVTLTFPDRNSPPLRSQAAFPDGLYPCPMPDTLDCVEISGLCTHPDYRKGDLLNTVLEHVARAFLLSDRGHIVTLADDHLLPLYRKLGFADRKAACAYLDRRHHLITLSRRDAITARRGSLVAWHAVTGRVVADLRRRGLLKLSPWDSLRVRGLLALRPWVEGLMRRKLAAEYRRRTRPIETRPPNAKAETPC